jgi:flavin-dependent dehydrogenase
MPKNIKILVIGAGIAGPAICYWLKKFGFSPALIEKSATIRKSGQALDIRGIARYPRFYSSSSSKLFLKRAANGFIDG